MNQYFDTANVYFLPLKMDVNNEVCKYVGFPIKNPKCQPHQNFEIQLTYR